jgi:hypothetical protein
MSSHRHGRTFFLSDLGLLSSWLQSSRWQHVTLIRSFSFDRLWFLWGFDESGAHWSWLEPPWSALLLELSCDLQRHDVTRVAPLFLMGKNEQSNEEGILHWLNAWRGSKNVDGVEIRVLRVNTSEFATGSTLSASLVV